jgi:hypothetical protein
MEHAAIPWGTWVEPDIRCKLLCRSAIIRKLRTASFVFCDEEESPWPDTCDGFTAAYTWWKQWNYWSVSFIKSFLKFVLINYRSIYTFSVRIGTSRRRRWQTNCGLLRTTLPKQPPLITYTGTRATCGFMNGKHLHVSYEGKIKTH